MVKIDKTTITILSHLEKSGPIPLKIMADDVGKSVTAIHERIKKLEREGIISRYSTVINREKIGLKLKVFTHVQLLQHYQEKLSSFEADVIKFPEVKRCYQLSGEMDYMLEVVTTSMDDYHQFILKRLASLPGISKVKSSFVMGEYEGNNLMAGYEPQKIS